MIRGWIFIASMLVGILYPGLLHAQVQRFEQGYFRQPVERYYNPDYDYGPYGVYGPRSDDRAVLRRADPAQAAGLDWDYDWWEGEYELDVPADQFPELRYLQQYYPGSEWEEDWGNEYELEVPIETLDWQDYRYQQEEGVGWTDDPYDYQVEDAETFNRWYDANEW